MMTGLSGFFGLLILILDIYALINIVQSRGVSNAGKVVWVIAILFLPLLGFVAWLFFGPRGKASSL
ncbi:MAG: hypothetical protein CMI02_05240 [Oceanospirillaceae bacterium]|nr:hypothetical protein [Oceanospirillaceae bacterium]MBT11422.1 hypothetical protein [Oceanospirillaceae bacterium]|tara:strand:- start:110124 stop:110321 length:198 start_codon:yes stop_codon:yes gene_type:complete